MTDISKCRGDGCLLALNCKRYLVEPTEYQLYFTDAPYRFIDGKTECSMYLENKTNDNGEDNERGSAENGLGATKETE